ncbi:MAG: DUF362 domain-containing protein [Desulfobacteraceae bacterium]
MTTQPVAGRRQFLLRLMRSTLMAAGAGALGLAFWDRKGPVNQLPAGQNLVLPDYSVTPPAASLAVAHGADRSKTVDLAVKALGGMTAFIKPGERVLLKVNAAFATPPILGATTHPDLVAAVVRLCYDAGAGQVLVSDNPINDPASCFALSGIGPAAVKAGAKVVLPVPRRFQPFSLPQGELLRDWPVLGDPLTRADKVIGLAPVKDHHRSGASLTIKNWYGLLGGRRNIFHQKIHRIIAELAMMIKPTLVILDGTQTMMRNGPTGGALEDLKATLTLIVGTDPVAVDALGATLLGKSARDLPHLHMAQAAGAGTVDYSSLNPVRLNAP